MIDSYDNGRYVVHVSILAQAYTWDIANESLRWYDAEVLGHMSNELIEGNARILGC